MKYLEEEFGEKTQNEIGKKYEVGEYNLAKT